MMGVRNSKTNKNGEVTMETLTNTTAAKDVITNKSKQNTAKKKNADNDNDRDPYYGGDSDNDF